jgi:hypothetical protein
MSTTDKALSPEFARPGDHQEPVAVRGSRLLLRNQRGEVREAEVVAERPPAPGRGAPLKALRAFYRRKAGRDGTGTQGGIGSLPPDYLRDPLEATRHRPGNLSRGSLGPRKALAGPTPAIKDLRALYGATEVVHATDRRGREFCFDSRQGAFGRVPCHAATPPQDPAAAGSAPATKPPRAVPKRGARLAGLRSTARRRRVLAALRSEAELAEAVDGYNLEDSLPGDVLVAVGPGGELLQTREAVHAFLATRAEAVARLKADPHGPYAGEYRRVAEAPLALVEVKTLLTSARGEVHISARAMRRKRAWEQKYNARFHLVVKDARRGAKFSGHAWHHLPALQGTTRLEEMEQVSGFDAIYERLLGGVIQ